MNNVEKLRVGVCQKRNRLPVHIAIIMDGNGRWAKKRFAPRIFGHRSGMKTVKRIVKESQKIGIKYLTLYAFSTENWKRPKDEVSGLMNLLVEYLKKELAGLHKNHVKIRAIGKIEEIYQPAYLELKKAIKYTERNDGLNLILAINYSGRSEIIEAVNKILLENSQQSISIDDFKNYLFASDVPDPDLVIRTGGELRISNFLLWQSAYSELFFTETLWPDFTELDYLLAIDNYQRRERRFGGL